MFSVARADCFCNLEVGQVRALAGDKVRVVLTHLQGEVRTEEHVLVYEALALVSPDNPFSPVLTVQGAIPLWPAHVFRVLRDRAHLADCSDKSLHRGMEQLFEAAQIATRIEGRRRQFFIAHSTCVAAVWYLLNTGLSEPVVSVLAHWSSQQVRRYGNRLILDPGLVEAFAFYHPVSLAGADNSGGLPLSSPNKRKRAA